MKQRVLIWCATALMAMLAMTPVVFGMGGVGYTPPSGSGATITESVDNATVANAGFIDAGSGIVGGVSMNNNNANVPGESRAGAYDGGIFIAGGAQQSFFVDNGLCVGESSAALTGACTGGAYIAWSPNNVSFTNMTGGAQMVMLGTVTSFNGDLQISTNKVLSLNGATATKTISFDGTNINVAGDTKFSADVLVSQGQTVYLNGSTHTIGITYDGTNIRPFSAPMNFTDAIKLSAVVADSATAPTVSNGCTGEAVTWGVSTANFRFDVGTGCTGITSTVITFPATTNCWTCSCFDIVSDATLQEAFGGCSTTTFTISNRTRLTTTATQYVDSADIQCTCRGG